MKRFLASLALFLTVSSLCACGRTSLDDFQDGGPPVRRDGRVPPRDGGGCGAAADCDDGVFCNGAEACVGGVCRSGAAPRCDDGVACTSDGCDEEARACQSVPDSGRCGPAEICDPGAGCVRRPCTTDRECDDGFVCNGSEACGPAGFCLPGMPISCGDGVECTRDTCSEATEGCVHRPDDGVCDDGRFCNGPERCAGGGCVSGDPMSCDDRDRCTIDRCDDRAGRCVYERIDDPTCSSSSCPDARLGRRTGTGVARGTTAGSRNGFRGSCGGDVAPERTFVWTAPRAGAWQVNTFGSSYDTLIYVLRSCVEPELPGACNDDTGGLQSAVTLTLAAGQRVVIVVDGFGGSSGDFVLNIVPAGMGTEVGLCADGVDNDGDGLTDCADPDCAADPLCGSCMPTAPDEVRCADGIDDDCDGLIDCRDPDCAGRPPCGGCTPVSPVERRCSDMRDDDCDGRIDCLDRDCMADPACGGCVPVAPVEIFCDDGRDDDCDGSFDCADTDCAFRPVCRGCVPTSMRERFCRDGRDDDCDGATDCLDADCAGSPACIPDAGVPDAGMCTARELGVAACTDGVDNDCDSRTDCADTDCTPFGPGTECCNGLDDDGSGAIDIFTCRCFSDAECVGVGSLEQVCWTDLFSVCAPRCNFYGGDALCTMVDRRLRCDRVSGQCVLRRRR